MIEALLDALMDSLKLLPFLFFTFLIMEYLEHKMTKRSEQIIQKSGKFGPLIGSILGIFPQCGFSIAATNFYIARIITLGTLFSVYLATSDEMLPILITEHASITFILKVISIKFIVGMLFGFLIDIFINKKEQKHIEIHHMCEEERCGCEHGILKPTIHHTLHIILFLFIVTVFLNICFSYIGEESLSNLFMKNSIFGPFVSSLIGLIPNCGASVIITELYLNNTISFSSLISGLLTGSGVALLVLFRSNKNLKENISILLLLYLIGSVVGLLFELI